jgi:hypothetical protein
VAKVQAQAIMSLDGYVAKQDNTIGRLFDWLQNGEVALPTPADDFMVHLSLPSAEHWRRWTSSIGALVCGRTLFDVTEGWQPPLLRQTLVPRCPAGQSDGLHPGRSGHPPRLPGAAVTRRRVLRTTSAERVRTHP